MDSFWNTFTESLTFPISNLRNRTYWSSDGASEGSVEYSKDFTFNATFMAILLELQTTWIIRFSI